MASPLCLAASLTELRSPPQVGEGAVLRISIDTRESLKTSRAGDYVETALRWTTSLTCEQAELYHTVVIKSWIEKKKKNTAFSRSQNKFEVWRAAWLSVDFVEL